MLLENDFITLFCVFTVAIFPTYVGIFTMDVLASPCFYLGHIFLVDVLPWAFFP